MNEHMLLAIQHAYVVLGERTAAANDAAEILANDQETLRWAKARETIKGLTGKNEGEREANLRLTLETQYLAVEGSERLNRACDVALKLAQLEVESLKMQLRVIELETARAIVPMQHGTPIRVQIGTTGGNGHE